MSSLTVLHCDSDFFLQVQLIQQTQLQELAGLSALGKQAEKHYFCFIDPSVLFSPVQVFLEVFQVFPGHRPPGVFAHKFTSGVFSTLVSGNSTSTSTTSGVSLLPLESLY